MTITFKLISKRLWPSSPDYSKPMTMKFESWEEYQDFATTLEGLMHLDAPIQFVCVVGVGTHDSSRSTSQARIEDDPSPEHERQERPRRPARERRSSDPQVQVPSSRES